MAARPEVLQRLRLAGERRTTHPKHPQRLGDERCGVGRHRRAFARQGPREGDARAGQRHIIRLDGSDIGRLDGAQDLGRVVEAPLVEHGLAERAPQRQAYRLIELQRFSEYLKLPLHVKPAFFPVSSDAAARLLIAVDQHDGMDAAMQLGSAIFSAVWAHQRNIADDATLAGLLADGGLDAARLAQSHSPAVQAQYDANTQQAIDHQIFGAPSYVLDGEIFWGQDRLDFLQRKLGLV